MLCDYSMQTKLGVSGTDIPAPFQSRESQSVFLSFYPQTQSIQFGHRLVQHTRLAADLRAQANTHRAALLSDLEASPSESRRLLYGSKLLVEMSAS